jgi:hypothetical protein
MPNINHTLIDAHPSMIDPSEAKRRWRAFRVAEGWGPRGSLLTPPGANLKLDKDHAVVSYGLSLAQSTTSGLANLCPFSTPECRNGCVAKNGNGAYNKTQRARALKVAFLLADPSAFLTLVAVEVDAAHAKYGDRLRVRFNTFSDIRWEEVAPWLFADRPHIRFYDYTKDHDRIPPANYVLTLSASERTDDSFVRLAVESGQNVAVVFATKRTQALPRSWMGLDVIDGDKTDNRADDPARVVVGLRAKGRMRSTTGGMVRHLN